MSGVQGGFAGSKSSDVPSLSAEAKGKLGGGVGGGGVGAHGVKKEPIFV